MSASTLSYGSLGSQDDGDQVSFARVELFVPEKRRRKGSRNDEKAGSCFLISISHPRPGKSPRLTVIAAFSDSIWFGNRTRWGTAYQGDMLCEHIRLALSGQGPYKVCFIPGSDEQPGSLKFIHDMKASKSRVTLCTVAMLDFASVCGQVLTEVKRRSSRNQNEILDVENAKTVLGELSMDDGAVFTVLAVLFEQLWTPMRSQLSRTRVLQNEAKHSSDLLHLVSSAHFEMKREALDRFRYLLRSKKERIVSLQADVDELKTALQETKERVGMNDDSLTGRQTSSAAKVKKLEKELLSLQQENESLRQQLSSANVPRRSRRQPTSLAPSTSTSTHSAPAPGVDTATNNEPGSMPSLSSLSDQNGSPASVKMEAGPPVDSLDEAPASERRSNSGKPSPEAPDPMAVDTVPVSVAWSESSSSSSGASKRSTGATVTLRPPTMLQTNSAAQRRRRRLEPRSHSSEGKSGVLSLQFASTAAADSPVTQASRPTSRKRPRTQNIQTPQGNAATHTAPKPRTRRRRLVSNDDLMNDLD